jgi:hypothetical protein
MKNELAIKIKSLIKPLSIKELIAVNKVVVERIKFLQRSGALIEMEKFQIGEIVSFHGNNQFITGRIIKFNQKTISIVTQDNQQWNVSPHLLIKKVE